MYPSEQLEAEIQACIDCAKADLSQIDVDVQLQEFGGKVDLSEEQGGIMFTPFSEDLLAAESLYKILKAQPPSARILDVLWAAIYVMPTNYTAWAYRRSVVRSLLSSCKSAAECTAVMRKELIDSAVLALKFQKNFQAWCHRRNLLESYAEHMSAIGAGTEPPIDERVICDIALAKDAKNYHVWSYRTWLVKKFNMLDRELEITHAHLMRDPLNNSAWVYRYFVHETLGSLHIENEKAYTMFHLGRYSPNLAAQNYMEQLNERGGVRSHQKYKNAAKDCLDEALALFSPVNTTKNAPREEDEGSAQDE